MTSVKGEFQEVMGMLRRLKGSIGAAEDYEELDIEVEDIMDKLFEAMQRLSD